MSPLLPISDPHSPSLAESRTATTATRPIGADARELYLDLLKNTLTRYTSGENWTRYTPQKRLRATAYRLVGPLLRRRGLELVARFDFDASAREIGADWPPEADTMVGLRRLDNIQHCVCDVIRNDVPGDLIETGVWRGGSVIFMRAILEAYGDTERRVWVADSFQGLPKPDPGAADDVEDALWSYPFLAVSLDQVKQNFRRYGLLDDRVQFLKGWFADTLPTAPVEQIAVMRLDGDLYESTMVALESLYPKLSLGGYVIIDDFNAIRGCRRAVSDFREARGITSPLQPIDGTGVYWQRTL